ncbi:MAG: AmmeMemoRadiSam system protein B [Clostridiales bacterium]|nr:AmmeMemoRadiSam system protein B [Clostridiales bacterium]
MVRKPAVAGYFYPERATKLRAMIETMVDPKAGKEKAKAIVSPHAGYVYSGRVAGAVFSSVVLPDLFVILGPSHRGTRALFAIGAEGFWQTPLGDVPIHTELAGRIMNHSSLVKKDESAHALEHSLEVQLPFIQYFKKDFAIVPVCISHQAGFEDLDELAAALVAGLNECGQESLIVASTDMSHYVSQETARLKDFLAIERILALDAKGLYAIVREEDISMCGHQPTAAAILAAKTMGATKAELVRYETSGETTGDYGEVVGYAGLRII